MVSSGDEASTGDEGIECRRGGRMGCQRIGSERRLFKAIRQVFCTCMIEGMTSF